MCIADDLPRSGDALLSRWWRTVDMFNSEENRTHLFTVTYSILILSDL